MAQPRLSLPLSIPASFFFGGWFLFHGLNYWFHFYRDRSIEPGPGLVPALAASGVLALVKGLEILIGTALLFDFAAALAIVAAWPITLMIAFVTSSHHSPFGVGVAVTIVSLNAAMSFGHLDRYRPMLALSAGPPNPSGLWTVSSNEERLPGSKHLLGAVAGLGAAIAITYLSLALRR